MMIEKPGLTLYGLFIVMALLAAAALLLGVAVSSILVLLLIYTALAYSINFITGMIGYVDFGHVLFMAIGSYALARSEEHTSELQSQSNLVCRLLLEKKKQITTQDLMKTEESTNARDVLHDF